MAEIFVCNI